MEKTSKKMTENFFKNEEKKGYQISMELCLERLWNLRGCRVWNFWPSIRMPYLDLLVWCKAQFSTLNITNSNL